MAPWDQEEKRVCLQIQTTHAPSPVAGRTVPKDAREEDGGKNPRPYYFGLRQTDESRVWWFRLASAHRYHVQQ
jgi:hypothetical protein